MALSGYFETYFYSGHYKIYTEWFASQNIEGNYSDITVKSWMYSDPSWSMYTSASKAGKIQAYNYTYDYTKQGISTGGGSWVYLNEYTWRYNHYSDGTSGAVWINSSFSFDCYISGTWIGTYSAGGNVYLDTIPRASTLNWSPDWTAGTQDLNVSINRASSSFKHDLYLKVQNPSGTWIDVASRTGKTIDDYTTMVFTTAEVTAMYQAIGGYENRPSKLVVDTWSGNTKIGWTERNGTVYGYTPATINFNDFDIGTLTIPTTLSNWHKNFQYSLTLTFGTMTKTYSVTNATPNITFDATDVTNMYAQTPNATSKTGNVFVSTKYNGVEINDGIPVNQNKTFTAYVKNSNPTFNAGYTYKDSNTAITAITGNDQYIIQNKSTLQVNITTAQKATAINGATMSRYEAVINGVTVSQPYSSTATVTFNIGALNISANTTLTVKAIDSRGNTTIQNKTVLALPYSPPTMGFNAVRANGFDVTTTVSLSGTISPVTISTNKNAILAVANPTSAPTLSMVANAGSTLAVGTYYVSYTWVNQYGETLVSPEASLAVTAGQNLVVTIPTLPLGATSANIYMNTVAGAGKLQGSTTSTTYTRSTIMNASGTAKPTINSAYGLEYRYKDNAVGTWSAWTNFGYTTSNNTYTATNASLTLDNLKSWTVEARVADKFGEVTMQKVVPIGRPIMFIDSVMNTIGINKLPTDALNSLEIAGALDVDGTVRVKANYWMTSGGLHGLDMRNSDIKGANGIYFNDVSDASDEGLNFLKTGKTVGSTNIADYDNFAIVDSSLKLNNQTIFTQIGTSSNIRLGGEINSANNQGVFFDGFGNIKAQSTVGASNTWNVVDGDGNTRMSVPIGKSTTGTVNIYGAYGGIDFYWQGFKCHQFWGDSSGRTIRFGDTGGMIKWYNPANRFEIKRYDDNTTYVELCAILTNASSRDYKKNIAKLEDSAIDIIMSSVPSLYHYNNDDDNDKLHVGLIAEDAPEIITGADGKTVDSYGMATLAWKAIQELVVKIENLDRRITMR